MRAILPLILVVAATCSNPFEAQLACTDQLNSTLALRIVNATSGAREGIGATVVVQRQGLYDSVTVASMPHPEFAYVAYENTIGAGVYSVTVRKPGFAAQTFDVRVTADQCHAGPGPHVEVRLVPAP